MYSIIGLSELLTEPEAVKDLDHVTRNRLQTLHTVTQSLFGIINDVLDYSKYEAGQLELRNTDPVDVYVSTL